MENKCLLCNGLGYDKNKKYNFTINDPIDFIIEKIICKKCKGSGELDWIEQITEKRTDDLKDKHIVITEECFDFLISKIEEIGEKIK